MKILVVTQYFWPEVFRVNDLVLALNRSGHHVTVLTGMPNYPAGKFYPGYRALHPFTDYFEGIKILRVPLVPRGNSSSLRLAMNYISFALISSLVAPFRCPRDIDLIFVFEPSPITVGLPAVLLRKLWGTPLMFWVQDLWPESLSATGAVSSKRVLKIFGYLVRYIYRNCDRILVQSQAFISRVVDFGANPKHVMYFPNWAERYYHPVHLSDDARERLEMPKGFRVLFAGNIGYAQSFETILGAAEILKDRTDIHWLIFGDGHQKQWVNQEIIRRGLLQTVHLLGRKPAEEMPIYFSLADALLVTLKKNVIFSLTIPSKIQSYLACARPIVAALDGEGRRIISESDAGLACDAEDTKKLAQLILALYKMNPEDRNRMGNNGLTYYRHNFERDELIRRLETWMEILISEKRCES